MEVLNIIGGGKKLPTLSNPATAAQILAGYQAINQAGEVMVGENVGTKFASGIITLNGFGTNTTITLGWRPRYVFVQLTQTTSADDYATLSYIDGLFTGFCRTSDRAYFIQNGSLSDITPTDYGFVASCKPHRANMYGTGYCYFFDGFGDTQYWAIG